VATALDIRVFRERWERVGRLHDWTDDEVGCIVDIVDRTRGDRTFEDLCVFEGNIIETFRVARDMGYTVIMPYTVAPGQTPAMFARDVVSDLIRRFPGRPAEYLYLQARRLALLTDDEVYRALWLCMRQGEVVLQGDKLMPAMEAAAAGVSS
jgi:hypothetical protein